MKDAMIRIVAEKGKFQTLLWLRGEWNGLMSRSTKETDGRSGARSRSWHGDGFLLSKKKTLGIYIRDR